MKFSDLLADHSIRAARMTHWKLPDDYLELPEVIGEHRTPWCYLCALGIEDGKSARIRKPILALEFDGDDERWEPYSPPSGSG